MSRVVIGRRAQEVRVLPGKGRGSRSKGKKPPPQEPCGSQLFLGEMPEVRTLMIVRVSVDSRVLSWGTVHWREPVELGDLTH